MIENDISQTKLNFWLAWIVANSIGLGFAWSVGELIGRQVVEYSGWELGHVVGIIVFEGLLWITRGTILLRIKSYKILRPVEMFIWVITEIFGWIINESPVQEGSLMGVTSGAIFATSLGAMVWVIFWFIKIPKPRSKSWAIQAFLWTFFGLTGGGVLIAFFQAISLEIGVTIAKSYFPIFGMAIAGVVLGGFLGSITGLALIKLIRWQPVER